MKKNIVMIGGSHGIGHAAVQNLKESHQVHIASRSTGNIDSEKITHHKFDVLKDDITSLDLPDAIHGFVYCPGSIDLKPFKMLSAESFQKDMELNFMGLIKVVKALLPKLKKADQTSLVFFSTVAVKVGMSFHTSVAAAKGAIEGFAKSLAAEYAPDFRVNVIAPSLTDTPMAENLLSSEEKKKKMGKRHPLGRVGEPEDVAAMVEFLLSEKSSWMTGQVIGLDGGMSTLNKSH